MTSSKKSPFIVFLSVDKNTLLYFNNNSGKLPEFVHLANCMHLY